jgi:hypothetical protein
MLEWPELWKLLKIEPPPFLIQEDIHPNYWGQLALRNCLRKEYKNGAPEPVGKCTIEGLTALGEPKMELKWP